MRRTRWGRRVMLWSGVTVLAMALMPGLASAQTLTDPVGDNCRDYQGPMGTFNRCGPDITQAVFSTPGDGNLHVDVTYASLPINGTGEAAFQEQPDFIELGIYPKSYAEPKFAVGTYRFVRAGATWKLQAVTPGLQNVGDGSAIVRALGIELVVPLGPLGDFANWRYVLNAGSTGEVVPEHPELAPNSGLFDLAAPPGGGGGGGGGSTPPASLGRLSGIPKAQSGGTIAGKFDISTAGDVIVDALVPASSLKAAAAAKKLKSIAKLTKRGQKAGSVKFKLKLKKAVKKRLAGKRAKVTLRLTLKAPGQNAVTATRKITLKVPR